MVEKQGYPGIPGHQSVSIVLQISRCDDFCDLIYLTTGIIPDRIRQYRCPLYHIRKMFNSVLYSRLNHVTALRKFSRFQRTPVRRGNRNDRNIWKLYFLTSCGRIPVS